MCDIRQNFRDYSGRNFEDFPEKPKVAFKKFQKMPVERSPRKISKPYSKLKVSSGNSWTFVVSFQFQFAVSICQFQPWEFPSSWIWLFQVKCILPKPKRGGLRFRRMVPCIHSINSNISARTYISTWKTWFLKIRNLPYRISSGIRMFLIVSPMV